MNTMIRYTPVETISSLFDDIFGGVFDESDRAVSRTNWPKVDITENRDGYTIKADLPGLDKSDVKIVVDNGVLKVEGERKDIVQKEKNLYYHLERSCGKFSRSFELPAEINTERVEAKMANGVLEINLFKTEKAKPKLIDVKVE